MVASAMRSAWRPPSDEGDAARPPPARRAPAPAGIRPPSSPCPLDTASGLGGGRCPRAVARASRSVAEPVASNSRSSSATASAVAEKATTIPVMTSACGTGSPPKPAAAPLRATTPNSRNTPLPSRLKARILRSGWGLRDQAVEPEPHQPPRRTARTASRRSSSGAPFRRAGEQQAERRRDRQRHRDLDRQDQRLGVRNGIGRGSRRPAKVPRGRRRGKRPARRSAPAAAIAGASAAHPRAPPS